MIFVGNWIALHNDHFEHPLDRCLYVLHSRIECRFWLNDWRHSLHNSAEDFISRISYV